MSIERLKILAETTFDGFPDKSIEAFVKEAIKESEDKDKVIAELKQGLIAVRELINESRGVEGLHLNGEVATWDSLESGGQFEEWLTGFNIAEDLLTKDNKQ